jgi:hypothetical protein
MLKKSFTYIEAIKAILYYLGVINMIGSYDVSVRGPSNWRFDNHQGDFTFNCHFVDAAPPFILKISNCRRNITTGNKGLLCCNRKDPTFFGFLRYSDDSTAIETPIFKEQNGNKIYFSDSKAQRIDILMVLDKLDGPFFGILYKILFG